MDPVLYSISMSVGSIGDELLSFDKSSMDPNHYTFLKWKRRSKKQISKKSPLKRDKG